MAGGCPTKYSKDKLKTAIHYIENYKESPYEDAVPTVAGLAVALKVSKKTVYNWADVPENTEFLHTVERLSTGQERNLVNGGLTGAFNPTITKLMMHNHGYSEKNAQDNDEDNEAPPVDIHFHVKEAVSEIKTTNAKP